MTQDTEKSAWFKRTEYDRSDSATRTQLVESAERVFSDVGYAKASIARITDGAGVARATFYVYFTSRQEVFRVLTEGLIADVAAAQRLPGIDRTDVRAIISSSITTILEVYTSKAGLLTVIEQQAKLDADVRKLWETFWDGQIRTSQRFVIRLQQQGSADPGIDAALASESMTAVLLHYSLRNAGASPQRIEVLAAKLSPIYERLIGLRR
ncbi:hypothetical protein CJ178_31905 [Rhodococcus sp. ACPA4]|uniref:TetR/AcrR family transcriptional regulator n=1 Tax=Rhodococcus sp. ACPA4 TaxID=2028571 RepID=UPI000BB10B01|nr:TetR/AcrR family transcriptional regulator [Rhodococcus sp. ACPA4]PBC36024.1 hypothetical protein CJ178_31905 [Rhodococcus sp. ACPA4]